MYNTFSNYSESVPLWWTVFSAAFTWIILWFFIYFAVHNGTFAGINPILLYWVPISVGAIFTGAIGGNIYEFLFVTRTGKIIHLKDVVKGAMIGAVVGTVLVFGLYYSSGSLLSIIGVKTPLALVASVDPVPLYISKVVGVIPTFSISASISEIFHSYDFWLMMVVAFSEEFLVLMTIRPFERYFLKKGYAAILAVLLAAIIAGLFWAVSHAAAYSFEGVPVISGIIMAFLLGTIFFRLLSEVIFKDFNIGFMVSAHFFYDFLLISVIVPLSFVVIH